MYVKKTNVTLNSEYNTRSVYNFTHFVNMCEHTFFISINMYYDKSISRLFPQYLKRCTLALKILTFVSFEILLNPVQLYMSQYDARSIATDKSVFRLYFSPAMIKSTRLFLVIFFSLHAMIS